ncbi:hypothetical protein [Enterococcus pallens]|uniref:Uncharacterized protein n=1 Tax=Enterococcus pallens ATCC BAA-351 TaxID=1158607 RepID=R2Q793_9ENTE|nr:hypothetical protein [Enterococcus pallens]EOH91163.1 hypothetical protein UAU_03702 [Enterococcus pallens ATCC BAA-351]EOU11469.1 hypothetical protein I588_05138 [Enterococcus pallens ATCC BAA-351]OJG78011.1 hypothetical protein RV10_GL002033 [Enterococcus pallens]
MKLTLAIDLLENEWNIVEPNKPVSPVPLIFATFLIDKKRLAFDLNNQPKLARNDERDLKKILKLLRTNHREYLQALDQDLLLSNNEHLFQQQLLVQALLQELRKLEAADELKLIRLELTGGWPLYQTEEGLLDLSYEED